MCTGFEGKGLEKEFMRGVKWDKGLPEMYHTFEAQLAKPVSSFRPMRLQLANLAILSFLLQMLSEHLKDLSSLQGGAEQSGFWRHRINLNKAKVPG